MGYQSLVMLISLSWLLTLNMYCYKSPLLLNYQWHACLGSSVLALVCMVSDLLNFLKHTVHSTLLALEQDPLMEEYNYSMVKLTQSFVITEM